MVAAITEDLWQKIPPRIRAVAYAIEKKFIDHGFESYIVGGCVRDLLLGKAITDIDFTTNAKPSEVIQIFSRTVPIGIDFGTVLVLEQGFAFEVTTFRLETDYVDGRHPTAVHFGNSLKEDVLRRDFTINGLAYSLTQRKIYDLVNGLADLNDGKIRTIGSAVERFSEDGLRPIRGCRFAAQLGFNIEPETSMAMKQTNATTAQVARERFFDEWRKTFRGKDIYRFWQLLYEHGIFDIFMKDLPLLRERFMKLEYAKVFLNQKNKNMAHYIAKFMAMEVYLQNDITADPRFEFQFIQKIFKSFNEHHKFPAKNFQQALRLSASPFFSLLPKLRKREYPTKTEIKQILSKIAALEIILHFRFFCDCLRYLYKIEYDRQAMQETIIQVLRNKEPLTLKQMAINGQDLLDAGFTGKRVGELLALALEKIIIQPEMNQKRKLLEFIMQENLHDHHHD